jgi:hypothetical protein
MRSPPFEISNIRVDPAIHNNGPALRTFAESLISTERPLNLAVAIGQPHFADIQ